VGRKKRGRYVDFGASVERNGGEFSEKEKEKEGGGRPFSSSIQSEGKGAVRLGKERGPLLLPYEEGEEKKSKEQGGRKKGKGHLLHLLRTGKKTLDIPFKRRLSLRKGRQRIRTLPKALLENSPFWGRRRIKRAHPPSF